MGELTVLLERVNAGDAGAFDELLPMVYEELRGRARQYLSGQRNGHTLQATALVHEAFLKLVGGDASWADRRHFYNAAAEVMRQILVSHARARKALKRGGGKVEQVALEDAAAKVADQDSFDIEALDKALNELKEADVRRYQVVMLRYFAGLGDGEVALSLGVSEKTVRRDWVTAKLFLHEKILGMAEGMSAPARRLRSESGKPRLVEAAIAFMSDGQAPTKLLDMLGDVIVLPPQEQTARLAELSISDADRAKLEKWLQLRGSSESFLEKPPSLVMRTIAVARGSLEGTSDSGSRLELADLASLEAMTPPSVPGYEIKNLLGQGGMGTVWRAVQTSTGREVALKVLEPLPLVSPRARARFERELRLAAQLCHPNIARVYDGGTTGAVCYNAMELIDGAPLDEFVESHGLSQRQILDLMIRICQAVAHAHQNAVIHRDLKPSNILVDKEGQPHLLDFGIARALEEATAETDLLLTLDGVLAGTPAYMSPEQASGISTLDTRTDVYSLGVILYQLLTGRLPRDPSGSRLEMLRRIAETEPLPPRTGPHPVDRLLEAILLRALARSPEDRYSSVADFAKDLDAYLKGEAVAASPFR